MVNDDAGDPTDLESMALAQLRRRYDELRADYEALLERLDELEATDDPGHSPAESPSAPIFGLREQLLAPLLGLRAEYADAQEAIGLIVDGLDSLTGRGLKGQREAAPEPQEPSGPVEVRVRGRSIGQLMRFRELLEQVEGVARVNIHAAEPDRAVLVVELD